MSAKPNPNSNCARALLHLGTLPPKTELSTSALAEAIGADANCMHAYMAPAVAKGDVLRRQKGGHQRSPVFWSLPPDDDDGKPVQRIVPANGAPPLGVKAAIWPPTAAPVDAPIIASQQWPTPTYEGTLPEVTVPVFLTPTNATTEGPKAAHGPTEREKGAHAEERAPKDRLKLRAALWSDGQLELRRGTSFVALLDPEETADLIEYLVATKAGEGVA